MAMTVGDLQNELAKLSPELTVMVAMNGDFSQVLRTASNPKSNFVVLAGKETGRPKNRFTTDEEGTIGHLVRLGLDNEEIGAILGRPADSVARKRKALGF